MIHNKRALSDVVTTLIIILLSLVAIGIVWVVVSNVIEGSSETADIGAKCLEVDIKATAASCTGGTCDVTYKRSLGGDDIDGLLILLSNGTQTVQASVLGNIAPLDTATKAGIVETLTDDPNSVEIAAYFVDSSGQNQTCAPGRAFEF